MKTSSLAIAAVILAGLSAPVFAADGLSSSNSDFDRDYYLTQLLQKGVNVTDVNEGAPGQIRATVQLADGSNKFQYFYEETLQPVKATGTNTRVLTKLDTGAKTAVPASTESLLEDHFFD